jgi:hypothetical protein
MNSSPSKAQCDEFALTHWGDVTADDLQLYTCSMACNNARKHMLRWAAEAILTTMLKAASGAPPSVGRRMNLSERAIRLYEKRADRSDLVDNAGGNDSEPRHFVEYLIRSYFGDGN